MIMAKPIDNERGKNMALGTPFITNGGANTARIQSRISNKGKAISLHASYMRELFVLPISKPQNPKTPKPHNILNK